jgi:hypothetical protein
MPRNVARTAQKFGLTNQAVKQVIHDAAVFAGLPENIKADIHGEVRKLGVDLRILTGWQAPASSGFHLSVNVAQVTTGSAKLEELVKDLKALPSLPKPDEAMPASSDGQKQ